MDGDVSCKVTKLLAGVAEYYSAKLAEHGQTARGVDWNGAESQELRFQQLCKIIQQDREFSLNDVGCGYGALYEYLRSRYPQYVYHGYDISESMIQAAQERNAKSPNARFMVAAEPKESADYSIASGIFNVRLTLNGTDWLQHIEAMLDVLNRISRKGFAFNCLTSYSDADKMRDYLYYADPCAIFDSCKRRYSRHVALLHDYGLYEFTILVRKDS